MYLNKKSTGWDDGKPDIYTIQVQGLGLHFDEWIIDPEGHIGLFRHGRQVGWFSDAEKIEELKEILPEDRRIDQNLILDKSDTNGESSE